MVAVNGCPSYEPHLPMPPGIWGPVGVANKGGQAMSMERVGRVPCPEHHGQEFWGLAPELQRERGRTGAAKPSGHLIHWIVRSVKPIRMDQAENLFIAIPAITRTGQENGSSWVLTLQWAARIYCHALQDMPKTPI